MKGRLVGFLALALAGGVVACLDDPTGSLARSPRRLVVNPNPLFLNEGMSGTIDASVLDAQLTPLRATIAATSGTPGVVTVTPDNTAPDPSGRSQAFTIRAVSPGQVVLNVTGGGLSTGDTINVMPLFFNGPASATALEVGDTLTLTGTAALQFHPDSAVVDFGGGNRGWLLSRTVNELRYVVPVTPVAEPARLTIDNINVTFVTDLLVELPTLGTFTITNPFDPNSEPAPAAIAAIPSQFYEGFNAGEANNKYTITLTGATTFTVRLEWPSSADLDILFCDQSCDTLVGNFDGATGANPEVSQVTLEPGTYNLWINNYVGAGSPPAAPIYRVTITTP